MGCHNCKYLSHDGSHLNNYLKEQLAKDPDLYTCKFPHPFRVTWLFGIGKYAEGDMMCGGQDFEKKDDIE